MCEKCYRRRIIQKYQEMLKSDDFKITPDEMEEIMRLSRRMSVMTAEDWFRPFII